jgi:hypothetical protein
MYVPWCLAISAAERMSFSEHDTAKRGLTAYSIRPSLAPCHFRISRSVSAKEIETIFDGWKLTVASDSPSSFSHDDAQSFICCGLESGVTGILEDGAIQGCRSCAVPRQFRHEGRSFAPSTRAR